ncbi:hypothetical protein Lalb_Chr11g0069421 [Lupinus albus]|uniref:Uncharacterized protein n=1 Tax=Lupinus albus TaxID=3870 RepID=A0A6A4PRG6_LUPAL|nr:hypothetical protein Lalb_Chr11g0069421 [Lupinus albus]
MINVRLQSLTNLPFTISLHLNLNASNNPNEFTKAHLTSSSKTFSSYPRAGNMI